MIIVSQDKLEAFNFDEIFRLYIDTWSSEEFAIEPNCWCIKAEKASDNMICAFLGEYTTKERAKEILEEIVNKYLEYGQIQNLVGDIKQVCNIPKKYEMPKE